MYIQTARVVTERGERRRNNKYSPWKSFCCYCLDVPFFSSFSWFLYDHVFFLCLVGCSACGWMLCVCAACLSITAKGCTGGAGARERTAGRIYGGARQITIYIKRHDAGDDHMQQRTGRYLGPP